MNHNLQRRVTENGSHCREFNKNSLQSIAVLMHTMFQYFFPGKINIFVDKYKLYIYNK